MSNDSLRREIIEVLTETQEQFDQGSPRLRGLLHRRMADALIAKGLVRPAPAGVLRHKEDGSVWSFDEAGEEYRVATGPPDEPNSRQSRTRGRESTRGNIRTPFTREQLESASHVRTILGWYTVLGVQGHIVNVSSPSSASDVVFIDKILEVLAGASSAGPPTGASGSEITPPLPNAGPTSTSTDTGAAR